MTPHCSTGGVFDPKSFTSRPDPFKRVDSPQGSVIIYTIGELESRIGGFDFLDPPVVWVRTLERVLKGVRVVTAPSARSLTQYALIALWDVWLG